MGWLSLVYLGLEGLGVFVVLVFVFHLFRFCFCFFCCLSVLLLDCFWCCSCSVVFCLLFVFVFFFVFGGFQASLGHKPSLFFVVSVFLGGFKGQVRWPKGPLHLALNPPNCLSFLGGCCFFFLLSFLCV